MTVAWVTGGGSGIGRALAYRLSEEGAHVVITGRHQEKLDETARLIRTHSAPGQILPIAGDAFDSAHVEEVVSRVSKEWGPINLLINNAGANLDSGQPRASFERYQQSLEINCLTAIRVAEAVLPAMRKAGEGSIVNISSIYGRWASGRSLSYSVGKYAMAGYTDALRQSLVGTGLHVMGVYPGFIMTQMTLPFIAPGSLKASFGKTPDQLARAVLTAWRRRKTELYFPWYVPWVLRFHRWMPKWSDSLANHVKT
jgi:short-subunit dehydrogenase